MKQRIVKRLLAIGLSAVMAVGIVPTACWEVKAASDISEIVENNLVYEESEINQLLTNDLRLQTSIRGLNDAVITYSVGDADSRWVSVDGNYLRITRPYAGEGNYSFILYATVEAEGDTYTKEIPLTIWEGLSEDSYAGYLYVCFSDTYNSKRKEYTDVQQIHFYLSEDGLNWTALNGNQPAFLTGKDYIDNVYQAADDSVNYLIKKGIDITKTVSGDASVLFPFEGNDQGVRDPYLIRGCKADGSDANKVWLLATDLNTHSCKYDDNASTNDNESCTNFAENICGNWGTTASDGSTNLFVWETEDFINWERRYIDVGTEIGAGAAWAPEAIYNPQKDNYLVYWSCRVEADGLTKNRLYCNETEDFVNFGPTKLYEAEPYFENYKPNGVANNDGYGNIDTSQLWVPETDENGKILRDENGKIVNPYGTLYRLVKDETNKHIELMSATSVLDSDVNYDESEPTKITPYEFNGKLFETVDQLKTLSDSNSIIRSEITHNWFINNSTGNHFKKISQKGIEAYTGSYEGATLFKFIDRDEWCVMIDYYGDMSVRYEPYLTTDFSKDNSIEKLSGGYGRTGGDIGCHGGMIPITVKEYNNLIKTYNSDSTIKNYHPIDYIKVDKRTLLLDKAEELRMAAATSNYSKSVASQMIALAKRAEAGSKIYADSATDDILYLAEKLLKNKQIDLSLIPPTPSTETNTEIVIDAGEVVTNLPEVKSVYTISGVKYQITKVDEYNTDGTNGTVTVTGMTKKTAKSVVIPAEIEIDGYTFAVNKIADKAFYKYSKLKTITIGDNVNSIGKNAFKGIYKKATFKVSSDNYDKVKKLLKSKVGFKKPMKLKEV